MRIIKFLIKKIYFSIVMMYKFWTEKIIVTACIFDYPSCNKIFKLLINLRSNLFEQLWMINLEYLKKLIEDVSDDVFLIVEGRS